MVKLGMGAWSPLVLCLYTHFYWLGFYVQFFWSNRQTYYIIYIYVYLCIYFCLFKSILYLLWLNPVSYAQITPHNSYVAISIADFGSQGYKQMQNHVGRPWARARRHLDSVEGFIDTFVIPWARSNQITRNHHGGFPGNSHGYVYIGNFVRKHP